MRAGFFIPLPDVIKNRKACVSVKNDDNESFKWAVLAGLLNIQVPPERIMHYKIITLLIIFNVCSKTKQNNYSRKQTQL